MNHKRILGYFGEHCTLELVRGQMRLLEKDRALKNLVFLELELVELKNPQRFFTSEQLGGNNNVDTAYIIPFTCVEEKNAIIKVDQLLDPRNNITPQISYAMVQNLIFAGGLTKKYSLEELN